MTAPVSTTASDAGAVLDGLLAALADLPEHLRRLRPNPWNDWITDVRGEYAAKRNQLDDGEEEL